MQGGNIKALVITSKEWLKTNKSADEKEVVSMLEGSPAVKVIYVRKNPKHPDRWAVVALIDVSTQEATQILDKVARALGYPEGVLSKDFMRKHIKDNPLNRLARV